MESNSRRTGSSPVISVTVIVSEATGDRMDGAVLVIAALIGSGVILLVGAVGAAARGEDRAGSDLAGSDRAGSDQAG